MENNKDVKFRKYPSMENIKDKWMDLLQEYNESIPKTWVATEKVDGANINFVYDGDELRMGKRSSFIGKTNKGSDSFYNTDILYHKYAVQVMLLMQHLYSEHSPKKIILYGEVFGGIVYDKEGNPIVGMRTSTKKNVLPAKPVQGRISYLPWNDLIFYDIYIELENGNSAYLPFNIVNKLLLDYNLPCVPIVRIETFDDIINLDVDSIHTEIPKMYGYYNTLSRTEIEGVVIRPLYKEFVLPKLGRAIFKLKGTKFLETPKVKTKLPANPKISEWQEAFKQYFAGKEEARLAHVTSNYEIPIERKNIGEIVKLIHSDMWNDFIKDYPEAANIQDKDKKQIMKKSGVGQWLANKI